MGSFNVACSVSNLSINAGDRVKYFILKGRGINVDNIEGMLIYSDCLMKPVALPISGTYDDYGRISPDKAINNKLVSEFFDLEIKDLVDKISQGELVNGEFYSGMFVLEEVYDKLVKFKLEENALYKSYLTPEVAEKIGFKKVDKKEQFYKRPYEEVLYRQEGFPYDLFIGSYGSTIVPMEDKEYYISSNDINEIYNDWESLTGTSIEEFPFNLNEIAELNKIVVLEEIKEKVFVLTGITMGHSQSEEKIYSVKSFVELYEELSEKNINLNYLKHYYTYDKEIEKALSKNNDLIRIGLEKSLRLSRFLPAFNGWKLFDKLYSNIALEDEIKVEIRNCMAFNSAMNSCNRFYFPAMNGEQLGNTNASKELLDVSLEIINKRIQRVKEYDEEEF